MRTQVINNFKDFLELKDVWNEVLQKCSYNVVFLTHEWLSAWWEDYGQGDQLMVILVWEEDELIAAAPLMIEKKMHNKLQFIAHGVSDYLDFIISKNADECFELIFKEIEKISFLWGWADFICLADESPNFKFWQKYLRRYKALYKHLKPDGKAIFIDLYARGRNWDEFEKSLPKKRRNDLKRCAKLLLRSGELQFKRYVKYADIEKNFMAFVDLHKKRWIAKGQSSQFDDDVLVKHYLNVARKLSKNRWIELACLKINDDLLAFAFCYSYNGRYYYYTPSFNPEYSKYSPGNLLIKYIVEDGYKSDLRIFDMIRGSESYKYVWGNNEIQLRQARIFNVSLKGLISVIMVNFYDMMYPKLSKVNWLRKLKNSVKALRRRSVL